MNDRLITNEMADQAWLRRVLQPEATRLAACYWWPTHEMDDARAEMRLTLARIIDRTVHSGPIIDAAWAAAEADASDAVIADAATCMAESITRMTPAWRSFAHEVLDEAIAALEASHDQAALAIHAAATVALQAGAARHDVVQAGVAAARSCTPLPPPWIVTQTIEKAARDHRFDVRAWQQRERRAS